MTEQVRYPTRTGWDSESATIVWSLAEGQALDGHWPASRALTRFRAGKVNSRALGMGQRDPFYLLSGVSLLRGGHLVWVIPDRVVARIFTKVVVVPESGCWVTGYHKTADGLASRVWVCT